MAEREAPSTSLGRDAGRSPAGCIKNYAARSNRIIGQWYVLASIRSFRSGFTAAGLPTMLSIGTSE